METTENILNSSSTKLNKMESTPKPANNGSKVKVKLKVAKKKVNIRRNNRFNRSNTSFNTSLNASKAMKKTLVANNRALADAVQMSKHEIAMSTEMIINLQKENIDLMMETGKMRHSLTQAIEDQVTERVKPLLQLFKSKVCEVSIHLTDVASAIKELSSAVTSQNKVFSNVTSRPNSVEIHQNLSNSEEKTKRPSTEKEQKSSAEAATVRRNSFNMSLIAESSYLNCDRSFDSFNTLDMVPENDLEKGKTSSDVTSVQTDIPPKRVSTEKKGSLLCREILNRRKSIKDEIDFGPHVTKSRKLRRSSFLFVPPLGYETPLSTDPETPLRNDCAKNDSTEQDGDVEKIVKPAQLRNPTLMDVDDDATILIDVPLNIKSMEVDTVHSEEDVKPGPSTNSELNILPTLPADPVQPEEDLAPVVNNNCPATTANTLPLNDTEKINHTNVSEIDMELTQVIDSSVRVDIEVSPFLAVPSTNEVKKPAPVESLGMKDNNQNAVFVQPIQIPKAKAHSKKGETKTLKKTKEKTKEATVEDDGKAVVELQLPKPGKFIFSATRKNTDGIRPSPPKARSKKKIAAMKKDELAAEPKNLFDFHDKTPQLLLKKPEVAADTGIYDVSLNDSVYGTCQSLGEYRERVAMAKRINPVKSTDVPLNSASSARTEVSADILETAAEVEPEEKKKRARSKKAVDGEKRGRSRSRKRVEESDDDSDLDNTYVKQYEKMTTKSSFNVDASERQPTRRARSKVVCYKELESDYDVTLTEIVSVFPLKIAGEKGKDPSATADDGTKETKPNTLSTLNSREDESKTAAKKETIRKSLNGTKEKRARSRKKSTAEAKTVESSNDPASEGAENSVTEKVSESSTPFELRNLMSRLEKLQKKKSHTQQKPETRSGEESQDPTETTSKPKSTSEDIFERYKRALVASNESDHNGEIRRTESSRSRSRSRSRPARMESPKTMLLQDQCGRSRSLRALKSKDGDDMVKITPEKRSRSVAKRGDKSRKSGSMGDMVSSTADEYSSQASGREEPKPTDESKDVDDNVNPTPEKKRTRSVAAKKTKSNASEDGLDHNVKPTPEKKRSRSVAAKRVKSDESKDVDDNVKTTPDKKQAQLAAEKKVASNESDDINDKETISKPEKKRSRSVAKKVNAASPPSSPLKKPTESPEVGRHQKTERGRSKSRVSNDAKVKAAVSGARYSSVEKIKAQEGSPEALRQKQRGRSKVGLKNYDFDGEDYKAAPNVDKEAVVDSKTNSKHVKPVGCTSTAIKSISSVADKENINTNVNISHMDAIRKSAQTCPSESSHKQVKSSSCISGRTSEDKTLSMVPRISSEKYPSKRSAEYVTEENQDLKRPRRTTKPISYKELSIGKKLRQGDSFFSTDGICHTGQDEETRKRSILDNVTNLRL